MVVRFAGFALKVRGPKVPYWRRVEREFRRHRDNPIYGQRVTLPRVSILEKDCGIPKDDADDQ